MKEKSVDSPSGGLSNVQYDPKLGRKLKAQKWIQVSHKSGRIPIA